METQDLKNLKNLMNEWSGGSDGRTRHMFNRRFIMTEGVMAVAQAAGCFWLLDIIATEVAPTCLQMWEKDGNGMTFFKVKSEGIWTFYLAIDGIIQPGSFVLVMLLPQEY